MNALYNQFRQDIPRGNGELLAPLYKALVRPHQNTVYWSDQLCSRKDCSLCFYEKTESVDLDSLANRV